MICVIYFLFSYVQFLKVKDVKESWRRFGTSGDRGGGAESTTPFCQLGPCCLGTSACYARRSFGKGESPGLMYSVYSVCLERIGEHNPVLPVS